MIEVDNFFLVGEKENILISQWGWEIPRRNNTSKVHGKINKCIFEEFFTLKLERNGEMKIKKA